MLHPSIDPSCDDNDIPESESASHGAAELAPATTDVVGESALAAHPPPRKRARRADALYRAMAVAAGPAFASRPFTADGASNEPEARATANAAAGHPLIRFAFEGMADAQADEAARPEATGALTSTEGAPLTAIASRATQTAPATTRKRHRPTHMGAAATPMAAETPRAPSHPTDVAAAATHVAARAKHVAARPTDVAAPATKASSQATNESAAATSVSTKATLVAAGPTNDIASATPLASSASDVAAAATNAAVPPTHVAAHPTHVAARPTHPAPRAKDVAAQATHPSSQVTSVAAAITSVSTTATLVAAHPANDIASATSAASPTSDVSVATKNAAAATSSASSEATDRAGSATFVSPPASTVAASATPAAQPPHFAFLAAPSTRKLIASFLRDRMDPAEVDDVVQLTLLSGVAAKSAPKDPAKFPAWILRIARARAADRQRGVVRADGVIAEGVDPDTVPCDGGAAASADIARLADQVVGDHADAEVLGWLARHVAHGDTYVDIAKDAGLPARTVRSRAERLLKRLAKLAREKGGGLVLGLFLLLLTISLLRSARREPDIVAAPNPAASSAPHFENAPPALRAARLRHIAAASCDAGRYGECRDALDEARRLDPAGEGDEGVKALRERAEGALR